MEPRNTFGIAPIIDVMYNIRGKRSNITVTIMIIINTSITISTMSSVNAVCLLLLLGFRIR